MGKPIILTSKTGITEDFPELLYADPNNEETFIKLGGELLNNQFYSDYKKRISNIKYNKSWSDLAEEYLKILI